MLRIVVAALLVSTCSALFFGGGCGCPPPPVCLPPPPPLCLPQIQLPQIQLPQIQLPQPCCPTCGCGRKKREISLSTAEAKDANASEVACNDDRLHAIMKKHMHGNAKQVKVALVETAERELGGRYTVICSPGTFSFVTSTNNYCLHTQNHLNCYLFKTE